MVWDDPLSLFDPDTINPRKVLLFPTGEGWVLVRRLNAGEIETIGWLKAQTVKATSVDEARRYATLATTFLFKWSILDFHAEGIETKDVVEFVNSLHPDLVTWLEKHLLVLNGLTPQRQQLKKQCLDELHRLVSEMLRSGNTVPEVPLWASHILNLYHHYQQGLLPNMAGLAANNPHLLEAFVVISNAVDEYMEEQRRHLDSDLPPRPSPRLVEREQARERAVRSAEQLLDRVYKKLQEEEQQW